MMARYGPLLLLLVVFCLFQGYYSLPPPIPLEFQSETILNVTNESSLRIILGGRFKRAALKTKWVAHSGGIYTTRYSNCIEVDATYSVSEHAHHMAATIIARMTKNMPDNIFSAVASRTKVGVFTARETLAVYPEYASYANTGGCGASCYGSCAHTCTGDGRKYSSLAGVGGARGVILDDNILCNAADPYHGNSNILVHEYAHSIMLFALSSSIKSRIAAAYNHARQNRIWTDTYAMSNDKEYWAVGTSVYFNSEHLTDNTGGQSMDQCTYNTLCTSETATRYHMWQKDIQLYGILTEVYTNNRPANHGNIGTCVHA